MNNETFADVDPNLRDEIAKSVQAPPELDWGYISTTPDINELATALSKAQGAMEPPVFDKVNPHFKSDYASLTAIQEATRPHLAANGLSIVQWPISNGDGICVVTRLMHSSGQWMQGTLRMPVERKTAHGIGSGITYGKRYSWQAICGIAAEEDDDGNAAAGKPSAVEQEIKDREANAPLNEAKADCWTELGQWHGGTPTYQGAELLLSAAFAASRITYKGDPGITHFRKLTKWIKDQREAGIRLRDALKLED